MARGRTRNRGRLLFSIYLGGHLAFVCFVASALKGIVVPAAGESMAERAPSFLPISSFLPAFRDTSPASLLRSSKFSKDSSG